MRSRMIGRDERDASFARATARGERVVCANCADDAGVFATGQPPRCVAHHNESEAARRRHAERERAALEQRHAEAPVPSHETRQQLRDQTLAVGRPKAPTHYIPPFTRVNGRYQQAVCGAWVVEREFSLEPTCPTCGAWLERTADEDAETAKALGLADKFVGGVDDGKA